MTWGPSSSGLDSRGVDLEELLSIDGVVVLFGDVRAELDGPVDPLKSVGKARHAAPWGPMSSSRAMVVWLRGVLEEACSSFVPCRRLRTFEDSSSVLTGPQFVEPRVQIVRCTDTSGGGGGG